MDWGLIAGLSFLRKTRLFGQFKIYVFQILIPFTFVNFILQLFPPLYLYQNL
jgi:hypothetical protein